MTVEQFKDENGYTIDGLWYPRVTKIVGIKAKPALYKFYGEVGGYENGQAISAKSAEEGTLIHDAVEALLLGQESEVDAAIAPAIHAFKQFTKGRPIRVSPDYVERRIMHPEHRYAGTVDAVAMIDGKFGVLDIKTSQAIYRDYNLQTAAYMEALRGTFAGLETRWILRIDQESRCMTCGSTRRVKGGREKIKETRADLPCPEHEWGEMKGVIELQEFPWWQKDFEGFLGAKSLWEWENQFWLKKAGYLS
ncbi:MAG: hypothetical protein A2855_01890 [Candidatus Liptonbacteria bacterium RIFCSPHIGHO2_01_FULL_57_28]|uniref:PD-(D/E)XK endonuclease-like domain-containing protein n=1 Tax=Candidatus Liptonbacteria bacterium RIFCSPHIGHO2_01_FULL_57_28 TaxID=1798647 RepID=A0A1G2CCH6_9BACT|nr:MAG: hypothetical protein A2855_01890 [Candidatus Liptonbacteria bacterium RIFCSPHIGHO2_01_FULL_57_28]